MPEIYLECKKSTVNFYDETMLRYIQASYIIISLIWIVIIFYLGFHKVSWPGKLILLFPYLVFIISYANLNCITKEVESEVLNSNVLSYILIVIVIIINWNQLRSKPIYFKVIFVALTLAVLSLIDFWVSPRLLPLFKHIKTSLNTLSLTLTVYALYIFYEKSLKFDDSTDTDVSRTATTDRTKFRGSTFNTI